jgi:hypothetical protein
MRKRVRGGDKVRKRFKATMQTQASKARIAVTKAAFIVGSRSDYYVPVDTSALLNSRFTRAIELPTGWRGIVGYSQGYAAALHERTDWSPKPPGSPGKRTGGYNPNAKPKFLQIGAEESEATIRRIFAEELRV